MYRMSYLQHEEEDATHFFVDDDVEIADFNEMDDQNHDEDGGEMGLEDYERLLNMGTDTTAKQARNGEDIQGIPWDKLNLTREELRKTRLEQYRNYENIPLCGEAVDKECKPMEKGGKYFDFFHNTRLVKPTILHYQLRNLVWATSKHDVYLMSQYSVMHWSSLSSNLTEVLKFSGHVAPNEKHAGSLLEGFTQTRITTLAVKDNFLLAGGVQGELACKRLDKKGVRFCTRTTYEQNASTNAVEIYDSPSGGIHFMASNNDGGVREYDMEKFQLLNHFRFSWPVNHTSISPDRMLVAVVGDHLDGQLIDSRNGKVVSSVVGHLDYSFASAWHPDGRSFATGNQDKTCRVWDIRKLLSPVRTLKGNLGAVRSIRYSSDGKYLVVAETADFVHVYSTEANYERRQEIDFFGEISGVSLSPDDECMYIGIWDRNYGSLLQYNRKHNFGYLDTQVTSSIFVDPSMETGSGKADGKLADLEAPLSKSGPTEKTQACAEDLEAPLSKLEGYSSRSTTRGRSVTQQETNPCVGASSIDPLSGKPKETLPRGSRDHTNAGLSEKADSVPIVPHQKMPSGRMAQPKSGQTVMNSPTVESPGVSVSLGDVDNDLESEAESSKDHGHPPGAGEKSAAKEFGKKSWRDLFSNNRSSEQVTKLYESGSYDDSIWVDDDEMDVIEDKWAFGLLGYIAGKSVGKAAVIQCYNNWNVKYRVQFHDCGWIVIKFEKEEDRNMVLGKGPFIIYGRPFMIKIMPDFFNFDVKEISKVPMWVRLPHLPLELWNDKVLSKIATRIGTPIQTDKLTHTKERTSFARVLVEVDVSKPIKNTVVINSSRGSISQYVHYEYMPKYCACCCAIGHDEAVCKKNVANSGKEKSVPVGPSKVQPVL